MVPALSPARVVRANGPLIEVEGLGDVAMSELVELGHAALPGEVVAVRGGLVSVQAYEYTGGVATGDPVRALGRPLSARLGPHLLGGVFDGLLRSLSGAPTWLTPDARREEPVTQVAWEPAVVEGQVVASGALLGTLPGSGMVPFRVMVPPGVAGLVQQVAPAGTYASDARVAVVSGTPVSPTQYWPLRHPRPVRARLSADEPLATGQRVLDAVFPVARGSTVAVPGGFGTGKTMLLQQIAKWCAADVIIYLGCGERGNEMADVLAELAELTDPQTGRPLAERTVIVANTSNMPMMAREASIYSGVTVAEFFRDMGYDAVLIADSTSRWAEALREFASRSGALPAEEGYPANLASALAAFYERAGRVTTLGGDAGSVTIVSAVSPPGGDTTEPVTAHTERFVRAVWGLDRELAYARHYPAVSWAASFSRDADALGRWNAANGDPQWASRRSRATALLAEADRLGDVAALVGASSLPARERVALLGGRLLRETVLQQSAVLANEAYCSATKTAALVEAVLAVVDRCQQTVERDAVLVSQVEELDFSPLLRAGPMTAPDDVPGVQARRDEVLRSLQELR